MPKFDSLAFFVWSEFIHFWSDCAIGYMILTFKVIKGHFRSKKFLWLVPQGVKVDFQGSFLKFPNIKNSKFT